jgi:hypothetical protein
MKRTLTTITILVLAVAAATMVGMGLAAPKTSATASICHAAKPGIALGSTTVAHGLTVSVTGGLVQGVPQHGVTATLQYRLSSAKTWKNGPSKPLNGAAYSITWKAPAKTGAYKVRVRVSHAGASNTSVAKAIAVN